LLLGQVTELRGHTSEGERRDGQDLPHVEVEVLGREVRVDERLKEVVVVVPCVAEDVRLVDHAVVDGVLEEWAQRGEVLEKELARCGGRCGAERDGGARRSGVSARCVAAATSEPSGDFHRWGLCCGVEMEKRA
jgi:hypothetical protein